MKRLGVLTATALSTGVALVGCTSSDQASAAAPDGGTYLDPVLPTECDRVAPEVAMAEYPAGGGTGDDYARQLAVAGDTVFFVRGLSIYAADVPDGVARPVVEFPPELLADLGLSLFWTQLWVDETSIVVTSRGAVYTAPRGGGTAVLAPGTQPLPDVPGEYFTYVRGGDFVYYAVDYKSEVFRQPIAGGQATKLEPPQFDSSRPTTIAANGTALFYVAQSTEEGSSAVVQSLPVDGSPTSEVWRGSGASGLGVLGDDVFVVTYDEIERVRVGQPGSLKKFRIPQDVSVGLQIWGRPAIVGYGGSAFIAGHTYYRLPDDRRKVRRPVVIRINPEEDEVEVLCVPVGPFDPEFPQGGQGDLEVIDLAASESGVFALRRRVPSYEYDFDVTDRRYDPHAVKVFP